MSKKLLAIVVAVFMANLVCISSVNAQKKALSGDEVKAKIAKLGTGPKAVVRVTLQDKTKVQGWVSAVTDDHFTVTDEKSGAGTTIAYADVREVKSLRPSKGALIAGVSGGVALVVVIFLFAGAKH